MRLEKNLQTYVKDRLEVRGTRYEGDAEIFYKMVISNIFVLSYALTYSNQLSTDVRRSTLSLQKGASFCDDSFIALFYTCNLHKTIETYMSYYAKLQHTHKKQKNSIPNYSFLERKGDHRRWGIVDSSM